jgi:hypothetical protein
MMRDIGPFGGKNHRTSRGGNVHSYEQRRWVGVALAAGAVLLLGSCSRSDSSGATKLGGQQGVFGVDGPATLKYLSGLDFTVASTGDSVLVKQYPCADPTKCPAGGVRLMFIPEQSAQIRDWTKAMTKKNEGYVVAAVLNVDGVTFPDLGLDPGKLAYAWVGQTGTTEGERGFAVYRIDKVTGLTQATWWKTSNVSHCDNTATRNEPSVKDKYPVGETCTPIQVGQNSLGVSTAFAAVPRPYAALQPIGQLWISCSGGCCQVMGD